MRMVMNRITNSTCCIALHVEGRNCAASAFPADSLDEGELGRVGQTADTGRLSRRRALNTLGSDVHLSTMISVVSWTIAYLLRSFVSAVVQIKIQRFFVERVIDVWNYLPPTVNFASLPTFKSSLKSVDFLSYLKRTA